MPTKRVVLLGASGYVGQAFHEALSRRQIEIVAPRHRELDYSQFATLLAFLRETKPAFLVNCAGFTGKPNVDACETAQADTLLGNAVLPLTIAHACEIASVPWGHVSSGCIYSGAKLESPEGVVVEKELTSEGALRRLAAGSKVRGYVETDTPNFSFRDPPCSFYSGTKALGEEVLNGAPSLFIWRLRIPFDHVDSPRNYITKLLSYPKVYDNTNSLSHRQHFANACLELWEREAPFGTYNVTNPGHVTSRQVVELIKRHLAPGRTFEFWESNLEFYAKGARAPRSNCVLDVSKLLATGVRLAPVEEAMEEALRSWRKQ